MPIELKAAVAVSEMAQMVGLGRARFYQLIGPTFPYPLYDVATRRPFYDQELQNLCLEVRRRNCGVNGKPCLFNAPRIPVTTLTTNRPTAPKTTKAAATTSQHQELLCGLKSLGLTTTAAKLEAAIKTTFPGGTHGVEPAELLQSTFLHLKANDAGGKD